MSQEALSNPVEDVQQLGDAIDILQLNPLRVHSLVGPAAAVIYPALGAMHTSIIYPSQLTESVYWALPSVSIGTVATAASTSFQARHSRRGSAIELASQQQKLSQQVDEPVEILTYDTQKDRKTALYWRLKTDDQQSGQARLRALTANLQSDQQPDSLLLPESTYRAMWPADEVKPITLNNFLKQQKRTAVHLKKHGEEPHVLVSFSEVTQRLEKTDQSATGLDFLLDCYAASGEAPGLRPIIEAYQQNPAAHAERLRQSLYRTIQANLQDVTYGANHQKRHLVGHLQASGVVLWIDDQGLFDRHDTLRRPPIEADRQHLLTLIKNNPRQAKEHIEQYLYLGLKDQSLVAHLKGGDMKPAKTGSELPSPTQLTVERYTKLLPRAERKARSKEVGLSLIRRQIGRYAAASIIGFGIATSGVFGVSQEYDRVNQMGVEDFQAFSGIDNASIGMDGNGGLNFLASRGNTEAAALRAVRNFGENVYYKLDDLLNPLEVKMGMAYSESEIGEIFSNGVRLNTGASGPTGNVGSGPNYAIWNVTGDDLSAASGYWIDQSYDQFVPLAGSWANTSHEGQLLTVPEPTELANQPGTLTVVAEPQLIYNDQVVLPIKAGMRLSALQVTSDGAPTIDYTLQQLSNGSILLIPPLHAADTPVGITYQLTPQADSAETTAISPLTVEAGSVAAIRNVLATYDPSILGITDPRALAAHISNHFSYAINPFDTATMDAPSDPAEYLALIYEDGKANCNIASTVFGLVAYANGITEPLAYATGFNNGDDGTIISSHEAHAFIIDGQGAIIDPTPPGPLTTADQAFFDEAPLTIPDTQSRYEQFVTGLALGGGALLSAIGAGIYLRRRRQTPAAERSLQKLQRTDPRTLALAHAALHHGYQAQSSDAIDDPVQPVELAQALAFGPVTAALSGLTHQGKPLPRRVKRTAQRLAGQRSSRSPSA